MEGEAGYVGGCRFLVSLFPQNGTCISNLYKSISLVDHLLFSSEVASALSQMLLDGVKASEMIPVAVGVPIDDYASLT